MQACHQVVENLNTGKYCDVSEDMLLLFCQLPDSTHGSLHTIILRHLNRMRNDPVMGQLILEDSKLKEQVSLEKLFTDMDMNHTPCPEVCCYSHFTVLWPEKFFLYRLYTQRHRSRFICIAFLLIILTIHIANCKTTPRCSVGQNKVNLPQDQRPCRYDSQ